MMSPNAPTQPNFIALANQTLTTKTLRCVNVICAQEIWL